MCISAENRGRGFTLIELLIAMVIALVIITALSSFFISQRKTFDVQEQVSEMVQGARAAMDMITREIKMAGYAPTGYDKQFENGAAQTPPPPLLMQRTAPAASRFVGIPYKTAQLEIIADLSGDGTIGDASHEKIVYKYYDTSDYPKQIKRSTNDGNFQPFAENIQSFAFEYYEADGTTTTTTDADIRQIKIEITVMTANPDPNYTDYSDGHRRYTLTSNVTPPNLGF